MTDSVAASAKQNILVLGDLLLDVIIAGEIGVVTDAPDMLDVFPGGAAANFASGAAGLGSQVRFVGRVGDDAAGRLLINDLAANGVNVTVKPVPGQRTGNVLVLRNVDAQGGSKMRSNPGASSTLAPEDLNPAWFENLDCLYLTGYSLLRPGPRAAAHTALALCRLHSPDALCCLDPGPGHLIADADPSWSRAQLAGLKFDLLLPNYEEGSLIAGTDNLNDIVDNLLELAPIVALKLGADGCIVSDSKQRHRIPAAPTNVVDTTGAGDGFAAGFVTSLLADGDIQQAAKAGAVSAAKVVARRGSR